METGKEKLDELYQSGERLFRTMEAESRSREARQEELRQWISELRETVKDAERLALQLEGADGGQTEAHRETLAAEAWLQLYQLSLEYRTAARQQEQMIRDLQAENRALKEKVSVLSKEKDGLEEQLRQLMEFKEKYLVRITESQRSLQSKPDRETSLIEQISGTVSEAMNKRIEELQAAMTNLIRSLQTVPSVSREPEDPPDMPEGIPRDRIDIDTEVPEDPGSERSGAKDADTSAAEENPTRQEQNEPDPFVDLSDN